jgi:hypothetical protein
MGHLYHGLSLGKTSTLHALRVAVAMVFPPQVTGYSAFASGQRSIKSARPPAGMGAAPVKVRGKSRM